MLFVLPIPHGKHFDLQGNNPEILSLCWSPMHPLLPDELVYNGHVTGLVNELLTGQLKEPSSQPQTLTVSNMLDMH